MTDLSTLKAMPDRREAILLRLFELAGTLVAEGCVFRNQVEIPEKKRPALVILDGDETADEGDLGRKRPANAPRIVFMTPEIGALVEGKPDSGSGDLPGVGAALNAFRIRVIAAVLKDASLVALCHEGAISYDGFTTGLAAGRSMQGESVLNFTFPYMLRPAQLPTP